MGRPHYGNYNKFNILKLKDSNLVLTIGKLQHDLSNIVYDLLVFNDPAQELIKRIENQENSPKLINLGHNCSLLYSNKKGELMAMNVLLANEDFSKYGKDSLSEKFAYHNVLS